MQPDINELLESMYSTEHPELLAMYHIDIEAEAEDGSWHGKLWLDREGQDQAIPFLAVSNANDGNKNRYIPITGFDEKKRFFDASQKAFPNSAEPADTACIYLELRQALADQIGWELA